MLLSKSIRSALIVVVSLLVSAAAQASNYSNVVNSYGADLLSYWQFNGAISNGGTATDSTGQRNGTYNSAGGSIGVGAGIPLDGFGTNQSVSVGGGANVSGSADGLSNDLPAGNTARTYTAWINTSNSNAIARTIFYYGSAGFGQSIFTVAPGSGSDAGFVPNAFAISTYNPDLSTSAVVNDGTWHFVAFTVTPASTNNATFDLYVDGSLDATGTIGTNTTAHSSWEMGNDPYGDDYTGLLAQVAVFDEALSGSQILALFDASTVPEPSSIVALAGLCGMGLFLFVRRRK